MADEAVHIPTSGGRTVAECDDCGHRGHFQTACKQPHCGCPSGIERKKQRDAEVVGAKGDPQRNTNPGFY